MNTRMYRRPKFLEVLLKIRQEMARESDYDVDLFAEMVRAGRFSKRRRNVDAGEDQISRETVKVIKRKTKSYGNRI